MKIRFLFAFMLLAIAAFGQQNPIQIDANGLTQTLASGGLVTRGQIVKINSSGQVVPVATTDTSGAIGIAATSQQNQGQSVTVSIAGTPLVLIDSGGCAAGNFVTISTIAAGSGHCSATSGSGQVGVALAISSPGSNFWSVQLLPAGGISSVQGVPGPVFNVKDPKYGAIGDAKKSKSTTLTNTQNTITDANNPFLSSDVGKFIFCIFTGDGTARLAVGTKIVTFVNAGSITVSANATGTGAHDCVWYTQKDTAAFLAADTAAISTLSTVVSEVTFTGPTTGYSGTVVCPPGGYVVDGVWFKQHNATINNGINFQGAGRGNCIIYQSPDITATNSNLHVDVLSTIGGDFGGFTLDCSQEAVSLAAAPIRFQNVSRIHIHDITLSGCGTSGDASGKFLLQTVNFSVIEQIYDNTGSAGNVEPTIQNISGGANVFRNINSTNPGTGPTLVMAGGAHGQTGGFNTVLGGAFDEGSTPGAMTVINGSDVQIIGTQMFAGTTTELNVDGTSTARLEDVNLVPFGGSCGVGQTRNAVNIASGGIVTASNSTFQGCGATGAINGPAGATFVDIGGNDIRNCPAAGGQNPCALVTPATFATLGYTGGIVPKSTQTHTPNTCYATTGNLLATAQNICTILLDQNYQVLNITAQSGGTTPANSSCTGAPVITMSDGTRTATLTMTTGKTVWSSSVDAATVGTVMASGATLTVSIGANTCATPPSNVSVNYVLQSVLNP